MRKFLGLVFIVGVLFLSIAEAQNFNSSEIVIVEGKKYALHQVEQGETIFSICKKFKIDQKELVNANPQLIFGLKQGDQIKIPYLKNENQSTSESFRKEESAFKYHLVKKSETIYSISRQYNIPITSIYRFNPEAEVEVLENEIIRIPLNYLESNTDIDGLIREDADYYYHKVQSQENLYSLARKYDAKVADILALNPSVSQSLDIGAIVQIPKLALQQEDIESVEDSGEYFFHRIEKGDTFYSYKRRFGVDQQKLIELNPELTDGLIAGLNIKIPAAKIQNIEVIPLNTNDFIHHIVGKGETLYGISKKYDVKILAIKDLNPELKTRGLIAGETILIAKQLEGRGDVADDIVVEDDEKEEQIIIPEVVFELEEQEQLECIKEYSVFNDDTFRISMFLPLFYDENIAVNQVKKSDEEIAYLDSMKSIDDLVLKKHFKIKMDTLTFVPDTILIDSLNVKEIRNFSRHYTRDFVNFYQGVILAVDTMQKAGAKVELTIYDSEYNQAVIDSILIHNDFINADLIIGPVDVRLQKNISDFSSRNQIPMVSPLSSNDALLLDNPYYFQVSPSKDYLIRKTSDFISDEFFEQNFIIMTLGNTSEVKENNLVDLVRDKFFSTGIYNNLDEVRFTRVDYSLGGNLGYWQVKKTLKPNMENVIFIPASDNRNEREAMLSQAINSLQVLSEEFEITLIGLSDYPKFESIYTEYYHRLKLHYLTPNNIDYTSSHVNHFIKKYRDHFLTEPDLYGYRGYDVAFFFIGAYEKFGKNFSECIGAYNPNLLQSEINFQKVALNSGYMNHTLYIKKYTPDYDVEVISKISEGRIVLK